MSDEQEELHELRRRFIRAHEEEEERKRAEATRPLPASVRLPRLSAGGVAVADAVSYQLIAFTWEPSSLVAPRRELSEAQAATYADWLNTIELGRLTVISEMLAAAGAPASGLREQPERLPALGGWLQEWFRLAAAPLVELGFLYDNAGYRLGHAQMVWNPEWDRYSRYGDVLVHSLAHDLAFLVADCARAARPGLQWHTGSDPMKLGCFATLDTDSPRSELVFEIKEFLIQSVAQPRGTRGRELRQWRSGELYRRYLALAAGTPPPSLSEAFPGGRFHRMSPRYQLSRAARDDPPAPAELAAAVAAFQEAGWFEKSKLAPADLARAVRAAWQHFEREDFPLTPAEMHWRLLVLDVSRTWSEDVDAGVRPGDGLHEETLFALDGITGKGFGRFYDVVEDWQSKRGDLLLRFGWGRRFYQVPIPAPGRFLSPALFTGLNALRPADGKQRLWFFDHGAPLGIVTRATEAERDTLARLTGVRLEPQPPAWWTALAPLAPPGDPALTQLPRPREQHMDADLIFLGSFPGSPGRPGEGTAAAGTQGAAPEPPAPGPGQPAAAPPGTEQPAGPRRGKRPPGAPTAQDAFRRLMRGHIGPGLREFGFTGSASRGYRYVTGDRTAAFGIQRNRYNTREEAEFWVHLSAVRDGGPPQHWEHSLQGLLPDPAHWAVTADGPLEPVAGAVLRAFRDYGWPAIQAAVDSLADPPGPPPGRWPRTFQVTPPRLGGPGAPPGLEPIARLLRPAGHRHDDVFAEVADPSEITRFTAMEILGRLLAEGDGQAEAARVAPVLLNRLEHDPSAAVRRFAAWGLRPLAGQPGVRVALQAAAREDEDLDVRWAARYAVSQAADGR